MFSLQSLFGKGEVILTLLEASAAEAHGSVKMLAELMRSPKQDLDGFVMARRKEKKITEEINQHLVNTLVTGLEREDIEALSRALYKIPKAVEKFAERYQLANGKLDQVDFSPQVQCLEKATDTVLAMVKQLHRLQELKKVNDYNERLQYVEGEADKLMLVLLKDLYSGKHDALKVLIAKDLYELMEKIIDRCRDAGNVVTQIVLKNS